MRGNELLYKMDLVDPAYVEAADAMPQKQISRWKMWGAIAACLCLLLAGCVFASDRLNIFSSANVSVTPVDRLPGRFTSKDSLIPLTEEEIFTHRTTTIIRGKVMNIQNMEINFNGDKEYRAIVSVYVSKVFRGDCGTGSTIEILLPCPIDTHLRVEDCGIISQLKVGMDGIFMPIEYEEDSYWAQNGGKLMLTDLAPYGLADGMRFAFLQTESGLLFESGTYKSIAGATTLDEIEAYIAAMLARTSA